MRVGPSYRHERPIWHRDPEGSWTFYETAPSEVACARYFGAGVDQVLTEPIELDWEGPNACTCARCETPESIGPSRSAPPP